MKFTFTILLLCFFSCSTNIIKKNVIYTDEINSDLSISLKDFSLIHKIFNALNRLNSPRKITQSLVELIVNQTTNVTVENSASIAALSWTGNFSDLSTTTIKKTTNIQKTTTKQSIVTVTDSKCSIGQ